MCLTAPYIETVWLVFSKIVPGLSQVFLPSVSLSSSMPTGGIVEGDIVFAGGTVVVLFGVLCLVEALSDKWGGRIGRHDRDC